MQLGAPRQAGCEKLLRDEMSEATAERPRLNEVLAIVRPGNTWVLWRLDRLGRSMKDQIARGKAPNLHSAPYAVGLQQLAT